MKQLSKTWLGFTLGPIAAILIWCFHPTLDLSEAAWWYLGSLIWIMIWWCSAAVPIAVAALLPLILFPMGIMSQSIVCSYYAKPIIFLFMGGFFISEALKKWELHRRFAFEVLYRFGGSLPSILGGFMISTALLSMWISNTATTIMMAAIGLSLIQTLHEHAAKSDANAVKQFGKLLMLAIAYSASIGGVGTLVGTPPNLFFASYMSNELGIPISMLMWAKFGIPFVIIMLSLTWLYFAKRSYRFRHLNLSAIRDKIDVEYKKRPPLNFPRKAVCFIFFLTALCWIFRPSLNMLFDLKLTDPIIAIGAAILLFCVPVTLEKRSFILDWSSAKNIPWDILLMFGGALAIAGGLKYTGVDQLLLMYLTPFKTVSPWIVLIIVASLSVFLSDLLTNSAMIAIALPIFSVFSISMGLPPLFLAIPATIGASAAFMLPVSTPPNAIVFSSNYITIKDMIKSGIVINVMAILVIVIIMKLFFVF